MYGYVILKTGLGFDFQLDFPGELSKVTVDGGMFVLEGEGKQSLVTHLWVAATGSGVPENSTKHLGTFVWYEGNARRVAHVFKLADSTPAWGGNKVVWHEIVEANRPFTTSGAVIDFLDATKTRTGAYHVWYTTNQSPSGDTYVLEPKDGTEPTLATLSVQKATKQPAVAQTATAKAVDNGMVFNYTKKDGTTRLVRLSHLQFHTDNGVQKVTGYDYDRHDLRTFILSKIVDFPAVV